MSGQRNSKRTEPRVAAVLRALEKGCTRRAAAGVAGINHATLYRWLDDDATFRDNVEKAEAKAEAYFTAAVTEAVPKSWQAAAWWLERRRNDDFAQRAKFDVTMDVTAEARRLAAEMGLDESEVMAEAQAILGTKR